jgi:DNA polymerase-1
MQGKPSLSLNLNANKNKQAAINRIQKAQDDIKAGSETMKEAWKRIFAMNNSSIETQRILEVKEAMDSDVIGRSPDKVGKKFSKAEVLSIWRELEYRKRDTVLKDMVDNTPANYVLIDTLEKLETLIVELNNETIIAVDTETTGLDYFEDNTVGMSFTLPSIDKHVYIPYGHDAATPLTLSPGLSDLARVFILRKLKPVLENPAIKKVLHNARFDIHMLYYDKDVSIKLQGLVHDTQIAMHILNENENSYRLKDLATKYLKEPSDTFDTLFGKNTIFSTVPLDIALVYAAKDTHLTWKLYQFQLKHLKGQPRLLNVYEKVENPLIEVVVEMEKAGFVIDTEYAVKLGKELEVKIETHKNNIESTLPGINLNSPTQLKPALESLAGHKIESTDKKALKLLKNKIPVVSEILDYKESMKLYGTYVDTLPKQIKPDGRVHGSFNQVGAKTGRFSSNNPNLQNQPKYARKLFIAPENMVLLSGDFSQQEPRLLAHFSGEQSLIDSYINGEDLYSKSASEVFNKPISECLDGSIYRKMMKMGILAVMYGTSPQTLSEQLNISKNEAENFIEQFYKKYARVKAFIDGNVDFAKKYGYVEMLGGRKRRLPDIQSSDKWERLRAERQCTNAIIQGSAAIQTKLTMIALNNLCKEKGWQMALSVHDEVGVYANRDLTIDDVRAFERVFLETVKLKVPNKTDIELSLRWGEGKSIKEWFNLD